MGTGTPVWPVVRACFSESSSVSASARSPRRESAQGAEIKNPTHLLSPSLIMEICFDSTLGGL